MENQYQNQIQVKNEDSFITFKFDSTERQIKTSLLDSSGLIKEIKNSQRSYAQQQLQLVLPKWVNKLIFDIFIDFLDKKQLKIWVDKSEQLPDNVLQKLLWIGDYFQVEKFQASIIQDVLIPRIRIENCLQFLNEAFKKLRACEDSQDIWYMLLNTGMNFTAKNLLQIFQKSPVELQKINQKILEEIIERTLKFNKNKPEFDLKEMVKVLLQVKQKSDFLDLITLQNKAITNKKINFSNHPSISWKLANISSIVNKETNPFKFNDYQWKLAAKMEEIKGQNNSSQILIEQKKQKTLRIYLKLEKQTKDGKQTIQEENSEEPSKIIAIYFLLKINDKHTQNTLQVKHIIVDRSPQILMCEFHEKEFGYYENKKLEFTVFLNTDYIYSLLLNYFERNWQQYYNSGKLGQMNSDDLEVIIKATPYNEAAQREVIKLALEYLKQQDGKQNQQNILSVFKALYFRKISPEIIKSDLLNSPVLHSYNFVQTYVEQQYQQRLYDIAQNNQSGSRFLSPNISINNAYQQNPINQTDVKIKDYSSSQQSDNFIAVSKEQYQVKNSTQSTDQKPSQVLAYTNKYQNQNTHGGSISPIRSSHQIQKYEQNMSSLQRENIHKQINQSNDEQKLQSTQIKIQGPNTQLNNLSNSQNVNMSSSNLQQKDFLNNLNSQNSGNKYYQQQESSSYIQATDASPLKSNQNQKQIENYSQVNQSQNKQNIQQVTSHTNSRIGYSPMTNLGQPQNQLQQNQTLNNLYQNNDITNNNSNQNFANSNSQLNTQVRKFDPQPLHSKSGIVLLNNTLASNINGGNSSSYINYNQNSQSDIKQFMTRTPHHVGNNTNNLNNITNNELPLNKFDKIRGNKSLNSQKPNISLLAGKLENSQIKNDNPDSKNNNQVNVDQSSSQIYFRDNTFGQNQNQQQGQNQQSLSLQKQQHLTVQSNLNNQQGNQNNYSQSGVSYNKSLFNFYPTSQSQQYQNSVFNSQQQSQHNQQNQKLQNQNKNHSLSQVSQSIQNYNQQYQPKNNMNRFGSGSNNNQMPNNSRIKIPNWQDILRAEKENRKNQLFKEINIANFIKPDNWLKTAYNQ